MSPDYLRGRRDADRFDLVRERANGWEALLGMNGATAYLIEPMTADYLDGLEAAGCPVLRKVERRVNVIDKLLAAISEVMAA